MARWFNIGGPCNPAKNYMLSAMDRLPEVAALVRKEQYFVVHAPRQCGKTTAFLSFANETNAKGAVTVDGLITANGWLGTYVTLGWAKGKDLFVIFGSGAGGGVHLTGASFAGAGTIQAKGGNAISGTVAGMDTAAGKTFKYASACGGGRVVITTGADVEGRIKILKDMSADWKSDTRVQELNSFNGTIDVAGGVNIWNATNKTGDPLQFEATHGAEGTVRYLRNIPAPGALLMIR